MEFPCPETRSPGRSPRPAGALTGLVMTEPKVIRRDAPADPRAKSCQWCEREFPQSQGMRQCYLCEFRVCLGCLPNHRGMHNAEGGDKCSKCQYGYLLPD
jgi:hypothetical protein